MAKLTGNTRYRSERKWGKERLILQVEEAGTHYDYCSGFVDSWKYTSWRDATTEDLTTFNFKDK